MGNREKRLKNGKKVISIILLMITVLMSCTQTFGATVQNTQNVKTYIYGFNISNTGKRWTGKADRQIKISTASSWKLKVTYHYLTGKNDKSYNANRTSGDTYILSNKDKIICYPKKGMVIRYTQNGEKSYYFEKLSSKEKIAVKKLIKNMKNGSWWGRSFKYSIGIYENYVLVGNTYGKLVGIYGIGSVKQTSYGYFIDIIGYNNYRWYKSMPNKLQCYSKASGSAGRKDTEDFWKFGC